jgi:hypothetical protein
MLAALCETVPGTGEVARFPAETLGTHKDGNTEYNVTSTRCPLACAAEFPLHDLVRGMCLLYPQARATVSLAACVYIGLK